MNPGLVVKLRPSGPWRIGPDSGARNRVDVIYHSDSLYSAVTAAMSRLGWLEEWLDATARTDSPAVSFSSCFPFLGDVRFVVPPRTIWPPASPSARAARIRWKSARFVPLIAVESILAGEHLDENQWSVDGASDCLVPSGKPGPFRTAVRSNASVDRLTGASERHSTACLEFRADSGLWTVVSFADEGAQEQWSGKVKAAFRLLADTGFGGERSRGWGRSEAPEFTEGMLPDLILPPPRESAAATAGPVEEAAVTAPREVAPLVVEAPSEAAAAAPEPAPSEAQTASEPGATGQDGVHPHADGVPAAEAAAAAQPEAPVGETAPEPVVAAAHPESGAADAPAPESLTEAETVTAEPESPAGTPSVETETEHVTASAEPESLPAAESAAPTGSGPRSEPMAASAESEAQTGAATEVPAAETAPAAKLVASPAEPESVPAPEPAVAETATVEAPAPEFLPHASTNTHPHWLLSLFTPAPADSVDWQRGNYTVLPRSGRIDSPAGAGELKKQIPMVAEGSVLYAEAPPRGSAADVAPEGFAHPVFRAGFAVAIPLPEVR